MNILCVGTPAWDGDYIKSTIQLMKALAANHRVLYVEYGFTYIDWGQGIFGKKNVPMSRLNNPKARLRTISLENGSSLHVLTLPPLFPINFLKNKAVHAQAAHWNAKIAEKAIKSALTRLQMASVDWHINAFAPVLGAFLLGKFNEKQTAYYCYDEITATPYLNLHGPRYESLLLQKVHLSIFSAEALRRKKLPEGKMGAVIKNAVDGTQFFGFSAKKKEAHTSPKIIGYLGSVDERLDIGLIEKSIRRFPDCIFRFVGRVSPPLKQRFSVLPNVELLGPRPPEDLPELVAQFDVCTIPFLINDLSAGIYPMKINEYFALGKAVVSTKFGDMSDFESLAYLTQSEDGYLEAIAIALQENDPGLMARRRAFAESNTWEARAQELDAWL